MSFSTKSIPPVIGSRKPVRGYSLIELLASLLLIAAIAVLSLPTYKDFSPHADSAGGESPDQLSAELADAGAKIPVHSNTDQPVSTPATQDARQENGGDRNREENGSTR